jgi:2-polyprenyl-3-methyl-5-hydroxy-6-metoxy-1,4-benzoquinol methylase
MQTAQHAPIWHKSNLKKIALAPLIISRILSAKMTSPRFLKQARAYHKVDSYLDLFTRAKALHLNFALTSEQRGKDLIVRAGRAKRVLDIGAAYAGFSLAALKSGAEEVVSVDIDPGLKACADALSADRKMKLDYRLMDICSDPGWQDLGKFDLIICNDVIEHVATPGIFLKRLCKMLSDDGRLILEIPNRFALDQIESDGHFNMFGITILPQRKADQYFISHLGYIGSNNVYYRSLNFYKRVAENCGVRFHNTNTGIAVMSKEAMLRRLQELKIRARSLNTPDGNSIHRNLVHLSKFVQATQDMVLLNRILVEKYWRITATRS